MKADFHRIILLSLLLGFSSIGLSLLGGCESASSDVVVCDEDTEEQTSPRAALVKVFFPDGPGPCNISTNYVIEEGDTALSVLIDYGRETGIPVTLSEDGTRVIGIKTVFEKDLGDNYSWAYTVNGESPTVGASEFELIEGDQVVWRYVDVTEYLSE